MTNYNERLDKILSDHGAEQGEFHYSLKQAITSLIKELVEEAKPNRENKSYTNPIYNAAVYEFEQNLLKALEEL